MSGLTFSTSPSRRIAESAPAPWPDMRRGPGRTSAGTPKRCHRGRVERRRDRFRPMASFVSALSSIVANSLQVMPTFPPPPLLIPYSGFSPVRLEASPSYGTLPLGFTKRLVSALAVHSVSGLSFPVFWYSSDAHRPLAQRGLIMPAPANATTA